MILEMAGSCLQDVSLFRSHGPFREIWLAWHWYFNVGYCLTVPLYHCLCTGEESHTISADYLTVLSVRQGKCESWVGVITGWIFARKDISDGVLLPPRRAIMIYTSCVSFLRYRPLDTNSLLAFGRTHI
jgi:hypothetical protein